MTTKKTQICVSTDTETREQLDELRGKISKSLYITLLINEKHAASKQMTPAPAHLYQHQTTDRS